jgi:hypothetical protein
VVHSPCHSLAWFGRMVLAHGALTDASCGVCFLQDRYPDLTIMQAIYWSVVTATTIGRPAAADLIHGRESHAQTYIEAMGSCSLSCQASPQ